METIKLPPLDPETLVILAVIGAAAGAVATIGGYLATKLAEAIGEKTEILPKFPEVG